MTLQTRKILFLVYIFLISISFLTYKKEYTFTTSFAPSSNSFSSVVPQGISSLFGAESASDLNPIDILYSDYIISKLTQLEWIDEKGVNQNIYQYYKIKNIENFDDPEIQTKLKKRLKKDIKYSQNRKTRLLTISLSSRDIVFGKLILESISQLVIERINSIEQKQSSEQSKFISQRLKDVKSQLTIEEEDMKVFMEENIDMSSPDLQIEFLRKKRKVDMSSEILINLTAQREIIKVEEVNNASDLLIVDPPYIVSMSSFFNTVIKSIFFTTVYFAFFVGLYFLYKRIKI